MQPIGVHAGEVMYFGILLLFRGELGLLHCDDICMCDVNKHFELLEFVFNSIYVDLKYNEISLAFTAGSAMLSSLVCMWGCLGTLCGGCGDCDVCAVVYVGCEYAERV